MKSVRGVVKGSVQGVGFRYFTRRAGERHQLSGWVKNLENGDVEFFAQGGDSEVDLLISELKKGPPGARVDKIALSSTSADETIKGFEIRAY